MLNIPEARLTVEVGGVKAKLRPLPWAKLVELEIARDDIGDRYRELGETPDPVKARAIVRDLDEHHRQVCRWGVESFDLPAVPVVLETDQCEGVPHKVLAAETVRDLSRVRAKVKVGEADAVVPLTQALAERVMAVNRPTAEDALGFR